MLVVMQSHATPGQIEDVLRAVRQMNLTPHPLPGATRTAIGITGNTGTVDPRPLEVLPGVLELIRVTKPYKLASREMHDADTFVRLPQTTIGPGTFTLIAGPCSVENEAMILRTAEFLRDQGVRLMRAGAFKPRSSPYSFQGMGQEGLDILARVRDKTGVGIVPGLMDTENADALAVAAGADGLLIEVHPDPGRALSDGAQSLDFAGFAKLLESLRRLADTLGLVIN